MERQISLVKEEALAACRQAQTSAEELEAIRVIKYLGKKARLNYCGGMGKVPPEERPRMGKLVNEARDELGRAPGAAGRKLAAPEEESGAWKGKGRHHPAGTASPLGSSCATPPHLGP